MPKIIVPTIGRVVWYQPNDADAKILGDAGQPLAAHVAYVHSAVMVNLFVICPNGGFASRTSVRLVQAGESPLVGESFCEWMPYQHGQAAKADAAEAKLNGTSKDPAGEQAIEAAIQAKGLTAPRLTPDAIDATIASEHYFTASQGAGASCHGLYAGDWEVPKSIEALGCLTFCVLVLRNGFTVTGQSACASPENYNVEIGRSIARTNARNQIWALEGYLLRSKLAAA